MNTFPLSFLIVILFFAFDGFKIVGVVWDAIIEPFLAFLFVVFVLMAVFL